VRAMDLLFSNVRPKSLFGVVNMRYIAIINGLLISPIVVSGIFLYLLLSDVTTINLGLFEMTPPTISKTLLTMGLTYFLLSVALMTMLSMGYFPKREKELPSQEVTVV
jgi:ABC-type tungstate transport system substrate-binding protein